mmetsp:Transcript_18427/g.56302  ORF Transcript_18427/g.56302 Transcript_18427/m.56302 type:complete len:239 (+) Transcript_18427:661-1377(+)
MMQPSKSWSSMFSIKRNAMDSMRVMDSRCVSMPPLRGVGARSQASDVPSTFSRKKMPVSLSSCVTSPLRKCSFIMSPSGSCACTRRSNFLRLILRKVMSSMNCCQTSLLGSTIFVDAPRDDGRPLVGKWRSSSSMYLTSAASASCFCRSSMSFVLKAMRSMRSSRYVGTASDHAKKMSMKKCDAALNAVIMTWSSMNWNVSCMSIIVKSAAWHSSPSRYWLIQLLSLSPLRCTPISSS